VIYQWAHGAKVHGRLSPQLAGEQLEALRQQRGGLTAVVVVAAAKPAASPLHAAFEWDNNLAANHYREEQARHLLRSVVVLTSASEEPTRAFVIVSGAADTDRYESISVVMADPAMRAGLLVRAHQEFLAWERRYHDLAELAGLFTLGREVFAA